MRSTRNDEANANVFVRPTFREADWNEYRAVNARFAAAIVEEAKRPDPIVLVQDYHFALLPKMIRERLPEATIITFWHIPWPNAETFGICPWKEEIIAGLLGSSVLGFHTQFHCNNFIDTVDRFIESRIDREHASVTVSGLETFVRPYPISIEWPPAALASQKPVADCRRSVRANLGLNDSMRMGVGIERFDYTKGILDRLRAVDTFFPGTLNGSVVSCSFRLLLQRGRSLRLIGICRTRLNVLRARLMLDTVPKTTLRFYLSCGIMSRRKCSSSFVQRTFV